MKVLLLGGTGSIGGAVLNRLLLNHHEVFALARSENSANVMAHAGAQTVMGDIKEPNSWLPVCDDVDAVIHTAASWDAEMGLADRKVVESVLPKLAKAPGQKAFIYTGGCWFYGATGHTVATEESPLYELPDFCWALPSIHDVLHANGVRGMVIHPAMVYERGGGVFEHCLLYTSPSPRDS